VTKGLSKGETYVFRYRAINLIGAGEWSTVAKLKAATKPIAPPRPTYISSTSTTITLGFTNTSDNGGSLVSGYKLYRDNGDLSSEVNIHVTSYNGLASSTTITGLSSGKKYRFRLRAINEFGESPDSLTLTIAASVLPEKPTNIIIDWT
jgi:titin